MEDILRQLSTLDPILVYAIVGSIAFIENLFPPFPSDVFVVAAGAMAAVGRVDFVFVLFLSATGSTAGFMTMYTIGGWFGRTVLDAGKWAFLSVENVDKVEVWFRKYGLWIIVVNRFLAGTRAVVSFVAGFSKVGLGLTTVLSFFSSLAWNFLLLSAGSAVGNNWAGIVSISTSIGRTTLWLVLVLVVVAVAVWLIRRQRLKRSLNAKP